MSLDLFITVLKRNSISILCLSDHTSPNAVISCADFTYVGNTEINQNSNIEIVIFDKFDDIKTLNHY